jgi:hypothetical protein
MQKLRIAVICAGIVLIIPASGSGHAGLITTYTHHVEKGELETMFFNDLTDPSGHAREEEGHGNYLSHMIELKYSPTDQLAMEFMPEWFEDLETGESKFTGYRYELRYRLFHEEVALNPMVYAEYENLHIETRYKMEVSGWVVPPYDEEENEVEREKILETRIILSQDEGNVTAAFNWINESDLTNGVTAFGYSLGILYRVEGDGHEHSASHDGSEGFVRTGMLGFELLGALGDTRAFGVTPGRQEHYFQPSLTLHVGSRTMVTLGFGIGLTRASDQLTRLNLGYKF